ncbi:ester cyclase [Nocardioides salsibiostraticola]
MSGVEQIAPEATVLAEANKALVRRLFRDIDALSPTLHRDYFSADYVDHTPLPIPGLASGIDGAKQVYAVNQAAFSDPWHDIEGQIAEGDLVVTWLTAGGRHTGELLGVPATDKDVTMRGVTIFEVVDQLIVSRWGVSDLLNLFVQLGAVPPPGGQ